MTTTFQVMNTRVEGNEIVVFYIFNNEEMNTNRFPLTTNFVDIMAWGSERAIWFDEREIRIAELQAQFVPTPEIEGE